MKVVFLVKANVFLKLNQLEFQNILTKFQVYIAYINASISHKTGLNIQINFSLLLKKKHFVLMSLFFYLIRKLI